MRPSHIPVTPLVMASEQRAKCEASLRDAMTLFLLNPRSLEAEQIANLAIKYKEANEAYWKCFEQTHGLK